MTNSAINNENYFAKTSYNKFIHHPFTSKIGFVLVLSIFCLVTININGHGVPHRHPDEAAGGSLIDRIEKYLVTTTSNPPGDSATDRAITKWVKAVKQRNTSDTAWGNLGNALMQKIRETGDPATYTLAEGAFQKAMEIRPSNVTAIIGISWVHGGRHQFEQSIVWANKALALAPDNQDAHGLIGDAAVELGNYDMAMDHYQKMLDIRPDLSSYSRAAHLMYLTGDLQMASWLMKKAIDAGGPYAENTAWCRAQLALMLWNTGAVSLAERELLKAIKISPNNYYVLNAMGKIKSAQKDYDGAIGFYRKAIAVTPNPATIIALGDLYLLKGENEKAERQFQRFEELQIHNHAHGHDDRILLARFYADHDRNLPLALEEAKASYKRFTNVFVTDTLAWCYYKNGHYKEAREVIRRALRWQTPDATILFHAGMIYAKLSKQ